MMMYSLFTVQRMIKYTGYGNAAGMLARRGLLMGGRGNTDYSDDEESSDTEEYRNARLFVCFFHFSMFQYVIMAVITNYYYYHSWLS